MHSTSSALDWQQAPVWDEATRHALAGVALGPGHCVLDVGCATHATLRALLKRVGPTGSVTGIDLATVTRRPPEGPPDDGADLVLARQILSQAPQPLEALVRLWRWARPGGVLVLVEADTAAVRALGPESAIERAGLLVQRAFRATGHDLRMGSRLPSLLQRAGIGAPDGVQVHAWIQAAAPSTRMLRSLLAGARPLLLQSGLSSDFELHRLDGDLAAAATSDVYCRWPDLVATWKRKPAGGSAYVH